MLYIMSDRYVASGLRDVKTCLFEVESVCCEQPDDAEDKYGCQSGFSADDDSLDFLRIVEQGSPVRCNMCDGGKCEKDGRHVVNGHPEMLFGSQVTELQQVVHVSRKR